MSDVKTYYHKLTQFYTLFNAWNIVKKKGTYGGVDKVSIEQFAENEKNNIEYIAQLIKTSKYSPEPYLKVCIPKNEQEKRELGLLTVQDKIVQTAIKNLIEPIFEKYFSNVSYGYRPDKGAVKAIRRVQNTIKEQKAKFILSVDIDNFFDTVPHQPECI